MLNVATATATAPVQERFEYHCCIDWSRLNAEVKMFTDVPPVDEPPTPIIVVDCYDNLEVTRLGRDYLRWEDGRMRTLARMMGITQMITPHLN